MDFCYREIPDVLDPVDRAAFRETPMAFYVGATDVATGEAVYHRLDEGDEADIRWMRASASMPLVSRPVQIGEQRLLDGGIVDAVPFEYMERLGYDRNVAVLTQPRGYRKKPTRGMALFRLGLQKTPVVAEAMARRHERYNAQMARIDALEAAGRLLVIRPEAPLGISRTERNPDELERVYQLGRAQGQKRLAEVRAYLGKT